MKKIISSIAIFSLMLLCFTACGTDSQKSDGQNAGGQSTESQSTPTPDQSQEKQEVEPEQTADNASDSTAQGETLSGKHHVTIEIEKYGTIEAELDADIAPITVTNFMNLAKSKFYDGLTFHRIISGFMIQGGDPDGNGTGGSGKNIKGEFRSNGVENSLSHKRGVLSMARSADPNSASSQFFIMHQDADYLDGEYAAFGTVTKGIEIVDKICQDTPVVDDNGTVLAENQPKITKITVVD
ncbi:MAG: peptidylprolyl isomerase [Lachnospiraceae bacterium]|nr:peptidylprolyl isomerase [Lachnospiraceae bacterium]